MTFWDHLDELRTVLIRIMAVVAILTIASFLFKEEIFFFVLAPKEHTFILYRMIEQMAQVIGHNSTGISDFNIGLVSTQLASQFIIHMKMSLYAGLLLASPYILYQLLRFVSPALYEHERRYAVPVVTWGYLLYIIGCAVCYLFVFPLAVRFLGTYQVSSEVTNLITLDSYISTFMMLTLLMGLMFELPIICWLFARLGFIDASFLCRYRRHAFVIILIIGTVVTPTADIFTLLLVSIPIYILYEISIAVVRTVKPKNSNKNIP